MRTARCCIPPLAVAIALLSFSWLAAEERPSVAPPLSVYQATPGKSPMTFELSLTTLADPKKILRVPGLRQYVCDDVLFTVLEVRRKRGDRTGDVLEVIGALSVRPSYDRDVDLIFELTHGGKVLRRQDRRRLDAEEGKVLEFKERMQLPKPAPDFTTLILRITMTVREGEGV